MSDVKVVLLVRDPRAMMHSRKNHVPFCLGHRDCDNPKVLCQDLLKSYRVSMDLAEKYPGRFTYVCLHGLYIHLIT